MKGPVACATSMSWGWRTTGGDNKVREETIAELLLHDFIQGSRNTSGVVGHAVSNKRAQQVGTAQRRERSKNLGP